MSRLSTPCISYCWIDPVHGHCEGCGRTRAEIASWCFITEEERLAVMQGLKARLDDLKSGDPDRGAPAVAEAGED
jgi:predicted Fe-S protein YdhL (DUF1289 family)